LNIVRIGTNDGFAYTIWKDYYQKVQAGLLKIKSKLGDILLANGVPIPDLPFWGPIGKPHKFCAPNNFEILGVCSRTEVETFLSNFDKYHNFQTDLPQNPDLQDPLPTPPPQTCGHAQKETPPHQTPLVSPINQSTDQPNLSTPTPTRTTWYRNDAIGMQLHQSNIYYTEDGTARASQAQQNFRTQTTRGPPTSKMREVLNNIGQTFQDSE
jgi:hypothetical protein